MTVIVSGATGFLGGALTRRLLANGVPVIALGRNLPALEALRELGAATQSIDLAQGSALTPPAEALVHCAALSAPWGRMTDFEGANVDGTRNALSLARAAGVRRFVHISTPSLYFTFADQFGLREDAPLPRPVNAYAATKRRAEALVTAATDLDPIILRPRGLYGRGDTALMPRLLRAAQAGPLPLPNHGRTVTDLTHVDDVVGAILAALGASGQAGGLFNISGGQPLNLRTVIERAGGLAGIAVRWRPIPTPLLIAAARGLEAVARLRPGQPEPRITAYGAGVLAYSQTLDLSAAAMGLGWRPSIGLDEGLARTFGAHL
jgi:nucleoside-diphosphate-sugar epimerase